MQHFPHISSFTPPAAHPHTLSTTILGSLFIFFLFSILCVNGMTQYMTFCVWFVSLGIMLSKFSVVPFDGWIIFHCIDKPQSLHLIFCWWTFGLFPLFGLCKYYHYKHACTHTCLCKLYLQVEFGGQMAMLFSSFWRIITLFSKQIHQKFTRITIFHILTNMFIFKCSVTIIQTL